MYVGVPLQCGYGGVVSVCRLKPAYGYHNITFATGPTTREPNAKSFYKTHHPIFITIMAIVRIPAVSHCHNKNYEREWR